MSQFTLTPAEDALVITALVAKSNQYTSMFGSVDPEIEALIAKVESQLAAVDAPVAEVAAEPVVVEATKPAVVEQVEEIKVTD